MKTVYDLHRFWTSMSAIFGFTFHIGRMTEALTPDIYIELTAFPFEIVGSILATDSYEKILQRSAESCGLSPGTSVSSHRECSQGGLG